MKCVNCKSKNTRVTCTDQQSSRTVRYCRCLDCKTKFKTEEQVVKYEVRKGHHTNAKLNVTKVKEIRANKRKLSTKGLAIEYDVEISTISAIKARKTWKNVD